VKAPFKPETNRHEALLSLASSFKKPKVLARRASDNLEM
jgi:hypothetical protein